MLRQRLITAAIGLPILVSSVWFGDPWFSILWAVATGMSAWEIYAMARASNRRPLRWFGVAWTILMAMSPHLPGAYTVPLLFSLAVIVPLIWLMIRRPLDMAFANWGWTLLGIFYVGWLVSYWVSLRGLEDGRNWVIWGFFVVFASDTFAYFVGKAWGHHLMAPSISPKKTWEGAAGGVFGSLLASVLFGSILFPVLEYPEALVLGILGSILAQAGDLCGSLLKRKLGCKDSGKFLPGHGGFIDRLSSLLFVGPLLYYGVLGYLGILF